MAIVRTIAETDGGNSVYDNLSAGGANVGLCRPAADR
jgi:hypothetical protein